VATLGLDHRTLCDLAFKWTVGELSKDGLGSTAVRIPDGMVIKNAHYPTSPLPSELSLLTIKTVTGDGASHSVR
jgi:hypothetical protein